MDVTFNFILLMSAGVAFVMAILVWLRYRMPGSSVGGFLVDYLLLLRGVSLEAEEHVAEAEVAHHDEEICPWGGRPQVYHQHLDEPLILVNKEVHRKEQSDSGEGKIG